MLRHDPTVLTFDPFSDKPAVSLFFNVTSGFPSAGSSAVRTYVLRFLTVVCGRILHPPASLHIYARWSIPHYKVVTCRRHRALLVAPPSIVHSHRFANASVEPCPSLSSRSGQPFWLRRRKPAPLVVGGCCFHPVYLPLPLSSPCLAVDFTAGRFVDQNPLLVRTKRVAKMVGLVRLFSIAPEEE